MRIARLFFLFLTVTACTIPRYFVENKGETGVNFTTGKWLLNEVEAPENVKKRLSELALQDFSAVLGNRLTYVPNARGLLISQKKIGFRPDLQTLKAIKSGTGYDYFINLKAGIVREDHGSVDLTPNRLGKSVSNDTFVEIEIYDLNDSKRIYAQRVNGHSGRGQDKRDVHLSASGRDLIIGAYRRLSDLLLKSSQHGS